MEEIRNKLDTNNQVIQIQALSKLLILTQKKIPSTQTANEKNIAELQFLWEKCVDGNVVVSDGVCKILVTLVAQNRLSFPYAINGFVSQVLSTRENSAGCLIRAIKDLIILHSFSIQGDASQQIFNLSSRVHPFIIILQHRPELWVDVLDQIKNVLRCHFKSTLNNVYEAAAPVLKSILWNPVRLNSLAMLRLKLLMFLRELSAYDDFDAFMPFMDELPKWLQITGITNVIESSVVLEELVKMSLSRISTDDCRRIDNLLLCFIEVCLEMVKHLADISTCLLCIKALAERSRNFPITNLSHASLVSLSSLLTTCLPVHQLDTVLICDILISRSGVDNLVSSCLILPLVTILNLSGHCIVLPGILNVTAKSAALALMSRLEDRLSVQGQLDGVTAVDHSASGHDHSLFDLGVFGEATLCSSRILMLAQHFTGYGNRSAVRNWFQHVSSILGTAAKSVSKQLVNFVAAIAIHGLQDLQIVEAAIDVLVVIGGHDVEKASSLISLLLYKLQRERDPSIRLRILKCLTRFAVHKVCTSSILGILRALGNSKELQPLCLRLMSWLWQEQERAFPQLQKLLLDSDNAPTIAPKYSLDDALLARAACIRDVCSIKPHLYGAEFLSPLSKIIISNMNPSGTTVTVLALESITFLCKAKVIDMQTTWKFLFQKLSKDKRPLVLQKMCELLALAESLKTPNKDYENFLTDSVALLWRYTQTWNDFTVNGAAYKGLACFDNSRHTLKHFCDEVKCKVKLPAKLAATPFDLAKKPEEVMTYVPGICYVDLLLLVHQNALNDYGTLLYSLVKQEMRDMPQALLSAKARSAMFNKSGRVECIERISTSLSEKYETRNLPGLQGSMALGLLLAYDYPLILNNDGVPTKQSIVKQGKMYENMLDVLLVQAVLEVSDWRKSMIFPAAWNAFMERLYFAMVETRLIQIEVRETQPLSAGENSSDNLQYLKETAWLFVRDKICSTLQNLARSKSSVHGNSLMALSGLASAILKYRNSCSSVLEQRNVQKEFMAHGHWVSQVVKAITNVLEVKGDVSSGRFVWCQPGLGSSCSIAQSYASLSIVILTPILINMGLGLVDDLLLVFFEQLRNSTTVPMLQFCLGVGLGLFGCQLVNEHFSNVGGDEGKQILLRIATKLRKWCFMDEELDSKCGGLLGLGMCTSAFCANSNDDFQEFAATVYDDLEQRMEIEPVGTLPHDILSVSRALVAISGCRSGILPKNDIERYAVDLQNKCKLDPNNSGIATAFGLLLHFLEANGAPKYMEIKNSQLTIWIETLKGENAPTLAKLAAINGAFSLMPICFENATQQVIRNPKQSQIDVTVTKFVITLSAMLDSSRDINLINCCTWMLGVSHWSVKRTSATSDGASLDYSYLPATSILRPVVAFIQDFIEKGFRKEMEPYVIICLKCLSQETHKPYPNLSWSSLLTPLFYVSEEIQEACVDVILTRLPTSAAAVPLASTWMLNSFAQLNRQSKVKLLKELPKLMNHVTPKTLHSFLMMNIDAVFGDTKTSSELTKPFVEGIVSALKAPSPVTGVTQILYLVVAEIFHQIDSDDKETWMLFCDAASHLSDEVLDQIIVPKPSDYKHMVKIGMLCCKLVATGKQPMHFINDPLDAILVCHLNAVNYSKIIVSLMDCFRAPANRDLSMDARIGWLLELMGHIKSIIHWQSKLAVSGTGHLKEVVSRFFDVFACSVVGWSSVQLHFFYWKPVHDAEDLLNLLPISLQYLMGETAFIQHNKKIIEWLIQMYEHVLAPPSVKSCCKSCLLAARGTSEFKKSAIWSRVMDLDGF